MKKNGRVRGTVSRFFSFSTPVRADRNMKSSWLRIVNCKPNEYPFSKKKKRKKKKERKKRKEKNRLGFSQFQDNLKTFSGQFVRNFRLLFLFVCLFVCLLLLLLLFFFFGGGVNGKRLEPSVSLSEESGHNQCEDAVEI